MYRNNLFHLDWPSVFLSRTKYGFKNVHLNWPIFLGRGKYGFKNFHLNWPNFFGAGVSMDSRTSASTGPIFVGRREYGFKKFHLNWPNIFWEGGSMDWKISTLTGPIFLGQESVWNQKRPPWLAQFFLGRRKYGFKKFHLHWPNFFWWRSEGISMDSKNSTFTGPIFFGRD